MHVPSQSLGEVLLDWFRRVARRLPWRETKDPYAIWISEIMLQRTRVEAVIPYFERFLERFPSAAALAAAPEEEVLTMWSGLGYYSRARNLRQAARMVAERGSFPETYEEILALPGVGEYTAAAVASIAFGLPHAVLDGNVMRVMSRVTCDFGDIGSLATRNRLRDAAQRCLPPGEAGDTNQALMELGATLCLPRDPHCLLCPLAAHCRARAEGVQNELPTKLRRPATVAVETTLLLIEEGDRVLMRQSASGGRMAGFWELPEADEMPGAAAMEEIHRFRHSIMNRAYRCTVFRAWLPEPAEPPPAGYCWIERSRLPNLPISTMAKKALRIGSGSR